MCDILDIAQRYVKHYSVAQKYAIKGCTVNSITEEVLRQMSKSMLNYRDWK